MLILLLPARLGTQAVARIPRRVHTFSERGRESVCLAQDFHSRVLNTSQWGGKRNTQGLIVLI